MPDQKDEWVRIDLACTAFGCEAQWYEYAVANGENYEEVGEALRRSRSDAHVHPGSVTGTTSFPRRPGD
ncbi:MAG: hypothetical protein O2854_09830 [Chloroflexi bacterium]|nr:hypothetical protein [Chloroflexota bacterium]